MTVYRKDPDAVSNWFNAQLAGIGHRGSSFTDIDGLSVSALTHDRGSRRFLFQEFKRPGEECSTGQWWALYDLARQPNTTVWIARQCDGLLSVDLTAFREVPRAGLLTAETIPVEEYRRRFSMWWEQVPVAVDDGIPSRVIWSEYVQRDPSLRVFIEGEIARANIALETARDNATHWKQVAERLNEQVKQQSRRKA